MSWLARSIANTLSLNDEENDVNSNPNHNQAAADQQENSDTSSSTSPRGVKEDLSELTKTLSRQFWGVASFLAPPPPTEPYTPLNESEDDKSGQNPDLNESESMNILGIRNDIVEIGGKFRSGITKLSNNINVSEITKIASNFLQLGSDEEDNDLDSLKGAVGLTEQAVAFARDISMHPETWLDFPLPENEEDEDFEMTDAQQEHALAVERLAPRLAALRIELCPGYMSESCFWKIYFVLLHPTLDKQDAELLSTPEVMEARALLAEELQNRTKAKLDNKSGEVTIDTRGSSSSQHEESLSVPSGAPSEDVSQISVPESTTLTAVANSETDKHPITTTVVADSETDKHPITSTVVADSETDKHPITSTAVADSETDKHPITSTAVADSETDKHTITSTEVQMVDKSVIDVEQSNQNNDSNVQSGPSKTWENKDEDDGDDWLKEETSEIGGVSGTTNIPIENEEDVSFSDLEEDDEDAPTNSKTANYTSDKDSREWVQL